MKHKHIKNKTKNPNNSKRKKKRRKIKNKIIYLKNNKMIIINTKKKHKKKKNHLHKKKLICKKKWKNSIEEKCQNKNSKRHIKKERNNITFSLNNGTTIGWLSSVVIITYLKKSFFNIERKMKVSVDSF